MNGWSAEDGRRRYERLLLNVVGNPCRLTLADLIYTQHTNTLLSTATPICVQTPFVFLGTANGTYQDLHDIVQSNNETAGCSV